MKKLYLLLLSVYLLFCLDSCRQSEEFELKGELEGITSDMILVVFDDPESKLDTIYPREGKFTLYLHSRHPEYIPSGERFR